MGRQKGKGGQGQGQGQGHRRALTASPFLDEALGRAPPLPPDATPLLPPPQACSPPSLSALEGKAAALA